MVLPKLLQWYISLSLSLFCSIYCFLSTWFLPSLYKLVHLWTKVFPEMKVGWQFTSINRNMSHRSLFYLKFSHDDTIARLECTVVIILFLSLSISFLKTCAPVLNFNVVIVVVVVSDVASASASSSAPFQFVAVVKVRSRPVRWLDRMAKHLFRRNGCHQFESRKWTNFCHSETNLNRDFI